MSDFESIEGSGLSEETEQALENEAEENLERLLYRDEQKFLKESQKKKKLKREIEAESLARLERLAKTEDDFKEVEKQWDRLDENADRRFRYHETVRGDVPLEYGMAEDSPVIPAFLNSAYWKAILKGRYLDILFDCPFEIQENITDAFIHELLRELKDEYKELLTFRLIRRYSTAQIAQILDQTDRNVRKKLNRILKKLRKKLYKRLSEREISGKPLTKCERIFLEAYGNQSTGVQPEETETDDDNGFI